MEVNLICVKRKYAAFILNFISYISMMLFIQSQRYNKCHTFAVKVKIRFLLCPTELIFCSEINKIFGLGHRPSNNNCQITLHTVLVSWILNIPTSENYVLYPWYSGFRLDLEALYREHLLFPLNDVCPTDVTFVTHRSCSGHGFALI